MPYEPSFENWQITYGGVPDDAPVELWDRYFGALICRAEPIDASGRIIDGDALGATRGWRVTGVGDFGSLRGAMAAICDEYGLDPDRVPVRLYLPGTTRAEDGVYIGGDVERLDDVYRNGPEVLE